MQEIKGDLFASVKADAICITTNGYTATTTTGVANTMGRGCAGEAKERWPGIEYMLGALIMEEGNHVHVLTSVPENFVIAMVSIIALFTQPWTGEESHLLPYHVVSFPTKPSHVKVASDQSNVLPHLRKHWGFRAEREAPGWGSPSLLDLITRSANELNQIANKRGWQSIVLPRMGCGAGELDWERDVKPVVAPILDDRFYIITFPANGRG